LGPERGRGNKHKQNESQYSRRSAAQIGHDSQDQTPREGGTLRGIFAAALTQAPRSDNDLFAPLAPRGENWFDAGKHEDCRHL